MSSCPLQHSSSRRDTVTQPPSPSGNPRGLCARAFPLWESPRSHVAHLPSGNPEGILPQSPGLRRRGATLGKCTTYQQPQRGCADGSNGWYVMCVYYMEREKILRVDSSSAPANTISFRPCFPHPQRARTAQPLCGWWDRRPHTRGNAADGATPGCGAQHPWRRGGELPWSGGVDRFGAVRVREGIDRLGVGSIL